MRRFLLALPVGLCCAAALTAATAAPRASTAHRPVGGKAAKHVAAHRRPSAPADEYFGRQKLSILGVRNTVHDLKIRYDGSTQRAAMVMSVGGSTEEAMRAWAQRYPGDLWLAHNMFQLDEIYMRVPTDEGRQRATALSDWIIRDYPGTYFEKYLTNIRRVAAARGKAVSEAPSASASPVASPGASGAAASSPVAPAPPTATPASASATSRR